MANLILEEILDILKDFNNPVIPLTKTALRNLEPQNLKELYFLLTIKIPSRNFSNNLRPKCPIKSSAYYCLARYPYKNAMNEYIGNWGFKFTFLSCVSPALYEATASFLKKRA